MSRGAAGGCGRVPGLRYPRRPGGGDGRGSASSRRRSAGGRKWPSGVQRHEQLIFYILATGAELARPAQGPAAAERRCTFLTLWRGWDGAWQLHHALFVQVHSRPGRKEASRRQPSSTARVLKSTENIIVAGVQPRQEGQGQGHILGGAPLGLLLSAAIPYPPPRHPRPR